MANFTKQAIEHSFWKLLNERPLSKITVKDIVADCGINRNTFYYYFEDIPKLIETIFEEDAETIIRAYPTVEKLDDCLGAVIDLALEKRQAVLHIYHSASREIYELYLWKICDYVVASYLASALCGRKMNESDLALIRDYLSSLSFGIVSRWLRDNMSGDIRLSLTRLLEIKKGMLEEMISRCVEA